MRRSRKKKERSHERYKTRAYCLNLHSSSRPIDKKRGSPVSACFHEIHAPEDEHKQRITSRSDGSAKALPTDDSRDYCYES